MGWIDEPSHGASQCSPWGASGARPGNNCSLPRFNLRYWRPRNSNSPLVEGLRKVFSPRLDARIKNAMRHHANKKRFAAKWARYYHKDSYNAKRQLYRVGHRG